jgi:hypothetical protein
MDAIEESWQNVLASWGDDDAHRRFINLCALTNQLAEAGKRYRDVRDSDPSRRDDAARRIDQLFAAAVQALEPIRSKPTTRSRTSLFFIVALSGAFMFLALRLLLQR